MLLWGLREQSLCVSKFFDTHHENLRIFMEGEGDCGNLKICGFFGRFPDQRNCFFSACAPEKPSATYTPLRSICVGAGWRFFDRLWDCASSPHFLAEREVKINILRETFLGKNGMIIGKRGVIQDAINPRNL